ncbi:zinc finger, CCHC-type containing protein [Tanacetum coccineum]
MIETAISDEDQALLLITSLPSSYENFMETLLYDRDTLKLEDVLATLNSRVLQKMTKENGDGGEGLYARVRYDKRDMKQGRVSEHSKSQGRGNKLTCYICNSEEHLKRGCPKYNQKKSQDFVRNKDQVSDSRADGHESADVMIEFRVRGTGTLEKKGFTVKIQSSKIKVIKGSLVVLTGTRMANYVYTLDGQAMTRKTLKGRKQLGEYQTRWNIKTGNVLDSCNQSSTQQCMKSGVARHLGVVGIQQQNGLVKETNMTLLAKVTIINDWIQDAYKYVGVFGWLSSIKQRMLEPVKVKCIFMGYREVQVLHGVKFEVEPLGDHTFEVEPQGNVG